MRENEPVPPVQAGPALRWEGHKLFYGPLQIGIVVVGEPGEYTACFRVERFSSIGDDTFETKDAAKLALEATARLALPQSIPVPAIDVHEGEGDGWEPIETAPLDGTRVQGYGPHTEDGYYIETIHCFKGKWTIQWMHGYGAPTHWRNLPKPPDVSPSRIAKLPTVDEEVKSRVRLAEALARIGELEEALKPFVKHHASWMDTYPDAAETYTHSVHTFGDLRRAVAALEGRSRG